MSQSLVRQPTTQFRCSGCRSASLNELGIACWRSIAWFVRIRWASLVASPGSETCIYEFGQIAPTRNNTFIWIYKRIWINIQHMHTLPPLCIQFSSIHLEYTPQKINSKYKYITSTSTTSRRRSFTAPPAPCASRTPRSPPVCPPRTARRRRRLRSRQLHNEAEQNLKNAKIKDQHLPGHKGRT